MCYIEQQKVKNKRAQRRIRNMELEAEKRQLRRQVKDRKAAERLERYG